MLFVFILHSLFLVGISYFSPENNNQQLLFTLTNRFLTRALKASFLIFMIGSYFSIKNILSILSIGFENYINDRIALGVGNGLIMLLAHWTYISCLLFFFIFLHSKNNIKVKKISFLLFVSSFAIAATYYGINSNRNSLFILLITLFAFVLSFSPQYYGRLSTKQLKKAIAVFIVAIMLLSSLHFIGKIRHQGKLASTQSSSQYGVVNSLNGAFGNHENIVWLMSHDYPLELGSTYAAAVSNFIPRYFWKEKPVGAGPKIKNLIYPGSYIVGKKGNSSLTTGFYTELLLNFGILGSLIASIFVAILLSLYFSFLKRQRSPIIKSLYIFSVVVFSSQFFYAEFLGFFARYIFSIIPFIFVYFVTKNLKSISL